MRKKHIIIGISAAGLSAARMLARLDKGSHILCLSQEQELPYNKCFLADYLSGEITWDKVQTATVDGAHAKGITIKLGAAVTSIDAHTKTIFLNYEEQLRYDTVFIGTGSSPYIPPITGLESVEKVYTFHTAKDTQNLLSYVTHNPGCRVVVIGAGLTGLECADALTAQGARVTVIERSEHILMRQIDIKGAHLLQQQMIQQGIVLYCNMTVDCVDQQKDHVCVTLGSGEQIQADMLVIATGVRPNGEIAACAGADMRWGGIVVNEYLQSSLPDVYAGGDVAAVQDMLSGKQILSSSWPDACLQGAIAARSMAGQPKAYPGVIPIISSSFFGLKFASSGPIATFSPDYTVVERSLGGGYLTFLMKEQRLVGFISIGSKTYITPLKRAVLTGQTFDPGLLLR